mgnify:FL=1
MIIMSVENPQLENLADKRQACEVYSRVVGYLRPVKQWNKGKQAEFADRQTYDKQMTVEET